MTNVKKFIQKYQAEILIVGGTTVAVVASIALHKHIVAGNRIHGVTVYTNTTNGDLSIVLQKFNKTLETIVVPTTV